MKRILLAALAAFSLSACGSESTTAAPVVKAPTMIELKVPGFSWARCMDGLVVVSYYSGNAHAPFYLRKPDGLMGGASFVHCNSKGIK